MVLSSTNSLDRDNHDTDSSSNQIRFQDLDVGARGGSTVDDTAVDAIVTVGGLLEVLGALNV